MPRSRPAGRVRTGTGTAPANSAEATPSFASRRNHSARPGRPRRLAQVSASPLRQTNFRWLFTGQTVSLLGSSMAPVALAFAVLDASDSVSQLGVVLVARMVPMLAFLLIGGATADRFSRRTVLVLSNTGSALTQGAVATVLLTGHYSL